MIALGEPHGCLLGLFCNTIRSIPITARPRGQVEPTAKFQYYVQPIGSGWIH